MFLGVIPARGGSKGVKRKNLRQVQGRPLIQYAIECASRCRSLDEWVVSTDDPEIADISRKLGVDVPFMRPSELATDTAPMLPVLEHALTASEEHYSQQFDAVVLLDPTAPLRQNEDIDGAIELFRNNDCDLVMSGAVAHRNPYFNMVKKNDAGWVELANRPEAPVYRRQDAPVVYDLNTVVWVYSRSSILDIKERIPPRALLFEVPSSRTMDIDSEHDLKILELLLQE